MIETGERQAAEEAQAEADAMVRRMRRRREVERSRRAAQDAVPSIITRNCRTPWEIS
jgi:hypothetical protein